GYSYEGMTVEDDINQIETQQQVSVSAESQPVNAELHLEAELQNEGNAQSDRSILPWHWVHSNSLCPSSS
ncbi:hypothetical protein, partial [Enterobacter hormaechei]|uniref:hypothetical protein n=1 Tax=Enterobacter hormaechei TaxID=158836 RepID=UPI0023E398FE